METPVGIRKTPWVLFVVLVCLISVIVGIFFGFLAGGGYILSLRDKVGSKYRGQVLLATGSLVGGVGGLIAALVWCRAMCRKMLDGSSGGKFIVTGGQWGVLVGVGTTFILHAVLIITVFRFAVPLSVGGALSLVAIGLGCALVAGGGFGLLNGAVCNWMVRRAASHGFPVEVSPPGSE